MVRGSCTPYEPSFVPQPAQNFAPGSVCAPQDGQVAGAAAIALPQFAQNFAPGA